MTLFDFTIDGAMVWAGMERARRHYGMPPAGTTVRRINTYYYLSADPPPLSEAERAAMAEESDARLEDAIARYRQLWDEEWLPELKAHHLWWEAFDLAGADDRALAAHARESLERMGRLWNMHFLVLTPGSAAIALLQALYLDEVGPASQLELQRLLQGFDNKTIETGRALWRLAQAAEASPGVRAELAAGTPAAELRARLEGSPEGRAWLAQLDEALQRYGQRYENWLPSNPSWLEDPTPAIESIRGMVGRPEADPDRRQASLAEEREQVVAAARARLADRPAVLARFDHLLAAAQLGAVLLEDHGYWIDTRGTYKVRRVFVEIGRRLAARGVIGRAEDVFHLWPDEAIRAIEGEASELSRLVDERKADMARFASVRPPMELGGPARPAPPALGAVARAQARVRDGAGFPNAGAAAGDGSGVLRGVAASAGIARGTVRVIRRLAEAARLRPGDVLVTGSTSPAWTPLFAQVAAVVTEVGGVLGHCGIVAREYRIPAVVGAAGATTKLRDGQTVEVDGTSGTVRTL